MNKSFLLFYLVLVITSINTQHTLRSLLTVNSISNDSFDLPKTSFAPSHVEFKVDISLQREDTRLPLSPGDVYDVGLYDDTDNFYFTTVTITKSDFIHVALPKFENIGTKEYKFALRPAQSDNIYVCANKIITVSSTYVDIVSVSRSNLFQNGQNHIVTLKFNQEAITKSFSVSAKSSGTIFTTVTKQIGKDEVDITIPSSQTGKILLQINSKTVRTIYVLPYTFTFSFSSFTQCIYVHSNTEDVVYTGKATNIDFDKYALSAVLTDGVGTVIYLPIKFSSTQFTISLTNSLKERGRFKFMLIDNNDMENPLYENEIWMSDPMIHKYHQFYEGDESKHPLDIEGVECPFEEGTVEIKEILDSDEHELNCEGDGCKFIVQDVKYGEFVVVVKDKPVGLVNLNRKFSEANFNFLIGDCYNYDFGPTPIKTKLNITSTNFNLEYISSIRIKNYATNTIYDLTTTPNSDGHYFIYDFNRHCEICHYNKIIIPIEMTVTDLYKIISITESINNETRSFEDEEYFFPRDPIDYTTTNTGSKIIYEFTTDIDAQTYMNYMVDKYLDISSLCTLNTNKITCASSIASRSFINFDKKCIFKILSFRIVSESRNTCKTEGFASMSITVRTNKKLNSPLRETMINQNANAVADETGDITYSALCSTTYSIVINSGYSEFDYEYDYTCSFNDDDFDMLQEGKYSITISKDGLSDTISTTFNYYKRKTLNESSIIYTGISDQEYTIKFNQKTEIGDILKITLFNTLGGAPKIELTTHNVIDDYTISFPNVNLQGFINGTYKPEILNRCGHKYNITSIKIVTNTLISLNDVIKHSTGVPDYQTLKYEAPFSAEDKVEIQLINIDDNSTIPIPNEATADLSLAHLELSSTPQSQQKLVIEDNTILMGYYKVETKYTTSDVETISDVAFHIYHEQLTLVDQYYLVKNNTSLNIFKILFSNDDIYTSRIKQILFNNETPIKAYSVDANENTILLQESISLTTIGKHDIYIYDLFAQPETPLIYSLIVISEISFDKTVAMSQNQKVSFIATVNALIPDVNIINKITTEKEDVAFTIINSVQDEETSTTSLTLVLELTDNTKVGKYEKLKVYNKNDTVVLEEAITYFILDETNAPIKVKDTLISVGSGDNDKFSIEFSANVILDDSFLDKFKVTLNEDECDFTFLSIDSKSKKLYAHSSCLINDVNFTFTLTFMDIAVTNEDGSETVFVIDYTYTACDPPLKLEPTSKKCRKCVELDAANPIYSEGECVDKCNDNDVLYDNVCYNTCNDVEGYNYKYNKVCYASCDEAASLNAVQQGYLNLNVTEMECVETCEFGFAYGKVCYHRNILKMVDIWDNCTLISDIVTDNSFKLSMIVNEKYNAEELPRVVKGRLNKDDLYYIELNTVYDEITKTYLFNEVDRNQLVIGEYELELCLVDDCAELFKPNNTGKFYITKPKLSNDHYFYKEKNANNNSIVVKDLMCNPNKFVIINDASGKESKLNCVENFPGFNNYTCKYTLNTPEYGSFSFGNGDEGKEIIFETFTLNQHVSEVIFDVILPICIYGGDNTIELKMNSKYVNKFNMDYITTIIAYNDNDESSYVELKRKDRIELSGERTYRYVSDGFEYYENSFEMGEDNSLLLYITLLHTIYNESYWEELPLHLKRIIVDDDPEQVYYFNSTAVIRYNPIYGHESPDDIFLPLPTGTKKPMELKVYFDREISKYQNNLYDLIQFEEDYAVNCTLMSNNKKLMKCYFNDNIENFDTKVYGTRVKCSSTGVTTYTSLSIIRYELPEEFPLCQTQKEAIQDLNVFISGNTSHHVYLYAYNENKKIHEMEIQGSGGFFTLTFPVDKLTPDTYSFHLARHGQDFGLYTKEKQNLLQILPLMDQGTQTSTVSAGLLNQQIVIKLEQPYTHKIPELRIGSFDNPIPCTTSSNGLTLTCNNVDTTEIMNGDYSVSYKDNCGTSVTTHIMVQVTINEITHFTQEKSTTSKSVFDFTSSSSKINIYFQQNFNSNSNLISFMFKNDYDEFIFNYVTSSGKYVTVEPDDFNSLKEGKYSVIPKYTLLPELESTDNVKYVVILRKKFELETESASMSLMERTANEPLTLTFKHVYFNERIKEIKCKSPSSSSTTLTKDTDYSISINDDKTVVILNMNFEIKGKWKIEIVDVAGTTVTSTLNVILKPQRVTVPEIMYFKSTVKSFKITFDQDITDIKIFKEIYVTKNGQKYYLNITQPSTTNYKNFMLSIFDESSFVYDEYTSLTFIDPEGKEIIESTEKLLIMKKESLPPNLLTASYIAIPEEPYINILFEAQLYEVYKKSITITRILPTKTSDNCEIIKLSKELNAINITCNSFNIIGEYKYEIKIEDKTYEAFTVKVQEDYCLVPFLGESPELCQTCKQEDSTKPYYYMKGCLETCGDGKYAYNNVCYLYPNTYIEIVTGDNNNMIEQCNLIEANRKEDIIIKAKMKDDIDEKEKEFYFPFEFKVKLESANNIVRGEVVIINKSTGEYNYKFKYQDIIEGTYQLKYYYINDTLQEEDLNDGLTTKYTFTSVSFDNDKLISSSMKNNVLKLSNSKCKFTKAKFVHKTISTQVLSLTCLNENTCNYIMPGGTTKANYGEYYFYNGNYKHSQTVTILKPINEANFVVTNFPTCFDYDKANPVINTFSIDLDTANKGICDLSTITKITLKNSINPISIVKSSTDSECISNCFFIDSSSVINVRVALNSNREYTIKELLTANPAVSFSFGDNYVISSKSPITTIKPDYFIINNSATTFTMKPFELNFDSTMTTLTKVNTGKLISIENNVATCRLVSSKIQCSFISGFNPKTEALNGNTSIDVGFKCSNTVTQKRNNFTLITYDIKYTSSKCMTKNINVNSVKINFNSDKNKPSFKFKLKTVKTGFTFDLTANTIMSSQLSTASKYEIYAVDNQNIQTLLESFNVIDNINIRTISELYADSPNQKMEITLGEAYTSTITNLVLLDNTNTPLTPPAKCTVGKDKATCTVDLTGVDEGQYKISFTDGCNNTVNPPNKVTVILNKAKSLPTDKFDVSTSAKNITIVFASPISDSISVELINISDATKVIVIPAEYIYSSGNNVIFTVLPETSNEGRFNIKVYNRDDNTIVYTVVDTMIITLISQTPILDVTSTTVINTDTSKNIKLPFKGIPSFYEKLISSITLQNPSLKTFKLDYTVTATSNNEGVITIKSETAMNVNGKWTIIVKDVFNRQYKFIITVISPTTVTCPSVVIVDNRSFNIQFSQSIPDLSLFNIISTNLQPSQSEFTITKQQGDTTNKKFILTLKDDITYTTSTKLNVYFFDKNSKQITQAEIIFVPPNKIPSQFISLTHSIERYEESITIEFDSSESVFAKYIELIEIKNDNEKCTISSVNEDKTIIFHCPSFNVVGVYTYSYYFNGNELTQFTITITEKVCSTDGDNLVFDPSTKQCKLCSAINKSKPFFYEYNCYAKCPDGLVIYNNACYNNCQSVSGADSSLYNENGVCKKDCTNGFKYQFQCVSTCEDGLYNNYKDKRCDTECPQGTLKYLTGCYETCAKAKTVNNLSFNLVAYEEKCVKQCKSNEVSFDGVCYANCSEVPQDPNQSEVITYYNKNGFCVAFEKCKFYVEEENTCFDEDCPNHYPYYIEDLPSDQKKKCYKSCPNNTGEYQMKCYKDCENIEGLDQNLMKVEGRCVEICDENKNEVLYDGKCWESCREPSEHFNIELFKDINKNKCQEECPELSVKYNYTCLFNCPHNMYENIETHKCIEPEECLSKFAFDGKCVPNCNIEGKQLFVYKKKTISECLYSCDNNMFIENEYTCVDECKSYIDKETRKCMNSCKPHQVTLENDVALYCYNECTSEFPLKKGKVCVTEQQCLDAEYLLNGNECVKECPITKVKQGTKCVDSCSEGEIVYKRECFASCTDAAQAMNIEKLFLSQDKTECYDRCPESHVGTDCITCNLNTHYIVNDECVSQSPKKEDCRRCHNQGSHKCNEKRHENKNKKCECNKHYTGASCEYYLGGEEFEDEKHATIEKALDSVDYTSHTKDADYRIEDVTQIMIDVGTQDSMQDYLYDPNILEHCQDIVDNSMEQLKHETEQLASDPNGATHDHQLSMGGMAIAAQILGNKGNCNGNNDHGNGKYCEGKDNGNKGNNGNGNGNGNKNLRNIEEETDQIKPIVDILAEYYFTYYISKKMKLSSNTEYPTVEISEGVISIQMWTDSTSKETLNKDANYYNISLTNISKCINAEDRELYKTIIYAKIDIDSSLTKIMSKGDGSINSNIFYIKVAGVKANNKFDILELDVCNDFTSRIPLEVSSMNKDLYKLAKTAGIEVYDNNTVIDYCTINDHFEFDLPKNYMQQLTNLNQKIYTVDVLGNPLNDCKYSTFDIDTNTAEIVCTVNPTSTNFGVQITPNTVQDNVDIKSAFKCVHKVRNLGSNLGFLLSIILIALMIIANVVYVLITCSNKELDNSDVQALSNDILVIQRFSLEEVKEEPEAPEQPKEVVAKPRLPPQLRDDEIVVEDVNGGKRVWLKEEEEDKIKIQKKFDRIFEVENQGSFELLHGPLDDENTSLKEEEPKRKPLPKRLLKTIMTDNFAELYPIISLFRLSLVTPFFLRMAYFVFHLLSLILTCAVVLMLNEKNIENRAKDTNRKSFLYPLTHEYIVIAMSIAFSMVLTLLIKLIAMVTYDTKFSLYDILTSDKELLDNKKEAIQSFTKQHKVRRIVGTVIILALGVGMLVVTMILCNYYVQTQIGLGLCFLWAILAEYIVLIPIFILIIGGIEHASPESKCVYYSKRLFMF